MLISPTDPRTSTRHKMSRHSARAAEAALTPNAIDPAIRLALEEDLGAGFEPGDLTTDPTIRPGAVAAGVLRAKAPGVLAGLDVFRRVFEVLAPDSAPALSFTSEREDGERVDAGDVVMRIAGPTAVLLRGERTALNFVQRMSGVATLTRAFVDLAAGGARILDTRKTTPGLRVFEKYAVRCGGGENHRFGLCDEVMVKDNHVDASGLPLEELVRALRERHGSDVVITAEARGEAEALQAVAGEADVVLLDNMSPGEMHALCPVLRDAASKRARPLQLEASGGVDLDSIAGIAATGVDRVSVGALTHSAPALDLSLALELR